MVHARAIEEAALNIPDGSAGHGRGQATRDDAPPPPPCPSVSLKQLLMMQNEARHGEGCP
jgi:hypothetical protein